MQVHNIVLETFEVMSLLLMRGDSVATQAISQQQTDFLRTVYSRIGRRKSDALCKSTLTCFSLGFMPGFGVVFLTILRNGIVVCCEVVQEFARSRKHKLRVIVKKTRLLRKMCFGCVLAIGIVCLRRNLPRKRGSMVGGEVRIRRHPVRPGHWGMERHIRCIDGIRHRYLKWPQGRGIIDSCLRWPNLWLGILQRRFFVDT